MKFRVTKGALVALGAFYLASPAQAANDSSYLPIPNVATAPASTAAPIHLTSHRSAGPVMYGDEAYGKYIDAGQTQAPVTQKYDGAKGSSIQVGKMHHAGPAACGCGCWFGTVGGVIMGRDRDDDIWFSYDTADLSSRVLQSSDAQMNWGGGVEARVGRYSDCGQYGWEVAYWGVYPGTSEANVYASDVAGDLGTIQSFDSLAYDAGAGLLPVTTYYDTAVRHRLRRDYDFHNVELNLLGNPAAQCSNCSPWVFSWLAGIRYFRFEEGFSYAGDLIDSTLGNDPEEIYYDVDVENNLLGFQLGGRSDYQALNCVRLFASANLGLYYNHMRHDQRVYGSQGNAVVNNVASPFHGREFAIQSSKDDVAFLGEMQLGMNYQITNCWSAEVGYRAVAITGVALSTNQVPSDYYSDLNGVADIDSNGSLILHGAFARAVYNF